MPDTHQVALCERGCDNPATVLIRNGLAWHPACDLCASWWPEGRIYRLAAATSERHTESPGVEPLSPKDRRESARRAARADTRSRHRDGGGAR